MVKIGVLIHGYNVFEENWLSVVWKNQTEMGAKMGRLPKGVLTALQLNAELIVFGTGASEKDGKIEATWMRDYLLDHFSELREFPDFKKIDLGKARKEIEEISKLETQSTNTLEELYYAGKIFKESGVELIFLVSSPDHISRCIRDSYSVFSENEDLQEFTGNLFGSYSQTLYGTEMGMPLVVESSHEFYSFFQRIMRVSADARKEFLSDLKILLGKYSL